MSRTAAEFRASLELIDEDVDLLRRVDASLLSATLELDGLHHPIGDLIRSARREITRRVEGHNEAKGVLRTSLKRAEREEREASS